MEKIRLGVMYGSRSSEHEVSIISAVQLMRSVNREKYDLTPIYITQKGEWYTGEPLLQMETYTKFDGNMAGLIPIRLDLTAGSHAVIYTEKRKGLFGGEHEAVLTRLDCVIPVFHGLHGEDGTIQGLLELCDLPYSSCGVGASAIGMDKVYMKALFRGFNFPVLPDLFCLRADWEKNPEEIMNRIEAELSYPVFVKPSCLGSSIGVSRAGNREELQEALSLGFEFDRKVLVEKGLNEPIELNCSVMGYNGEAKASEIEMPISGGKLLSFQEKYLSSGGSKGMASLKRVLPAPIGEELKQQIQKLSVEIFNALDCKGVVRIDYMLNPEDEQLYITEINTIPGSMAFYLWEKSGIPYPELIDLLVDFAMKASRDKEESNYAYHSDILSGVTLGGKTGMKGGCKKLF